MKKILLLVTLSTFMLISLSTVNASPQIDYEAFEKFNSNSKVYVTIVLKYKFATDYSDTYLKYRMMAGRKQISDFLLTLSNSEFESLQESLGLVPLVSGYLSKEGFEKLKNRPEILSIYIPGRAEVLLQDSVPLIKADMTRSIIVNNTNVTGKHQTVCVVDTGVKHSHTDLGGCFGSGCKVVAGHDFCSSVNSTGICVSEDPNPMDDNGHGTYVAGIAAANGGVIGVAPNVSIAALKMLANTQGDDDTAAKAIEWCIVNRTTLNISIISISIGYDPPGHSNSSDCYPNRTLSIAIKDATEAGILVVVASGNDASLNQIHYPACVNESVSVGAVYDKNVGHKNFTSCQNDTSQQNKIVCLTDRNFNLDFLAPGSVINSTNINGLYGEGSGTSAAAPHVAGVAALMLQAANLSGTSLTPAQTESIMKRTGKSIYDHSTGLTFKRVDAYRSLLSVLYDSNGELNEN